MNIPDKIRIAGTDYTTVYKDCVVLNSQECYGTCDYEHSIISISNRGDVGNQHQCVTYLHEMLHAIAHAYKIPLPEEDEEKIVDSFAVGLYQVIRDNDGVFENKK